MANSVPQIYLNSIINFAEVRDIGGVNFALSRLETHLSSDTPTYVADGLIGLRFLADLRDYHGIGKKATYLRNLLDTREVQEAEA